MYFSLFASSVLNDIDTVCPRSSDPIYIVTYYIKWSLLLRHTVYFRGKRGPELVPDTKQDTITLFVSSSFFNN